MGTNGMEALQALEQWTIVTQVLIRKWCKLASEVSQIISSNQPPILNLYAKFKEVSLLLFSPTGFPKFVIFTLLWPAKTDTITIRMDENLIHGFWCNINVKYWKMCVGSYWRGSGWHLFQGLTIATKVTHFLAHFL